MILFLDNYDSFVYNLVQYLGELGAEPVVHRHDALGLDALVELAPDAVLVSPGPGRPEDAGVSNDAIVHFGAAGIPVLGVCLGHQCIGAAYGTPIVRAGRPVHGKTSAITHDGTSIFTGLPSPIRVARYHSLVIARPDVPPDLRVVATVRDDQEVMAVEHREHPVVGVQFHPESAATEYGYAMLDRFLRGDRARPADVAARADGAPGTPPPVEDEPQTFVPPSVEHVR